MGGFLPDEAPTFKTMAARADSALFGAIINNQHHVLRSLCKERPAMTYNLRPRSHAFRNRNRKLDICIAPTKAMSREPAYSQALLQNKIIDRQRVRPRESGT